MSPGVAFAVGFLGGVVAAALVVGGVIWWFGRPLPGEHDEQS